MQIPAWCSTKTHERHINLLSAADLRGHPCLQAPTGSYTYAYTSVPPNIQHERTSARPEMDVTPWCGVLVSGWIIFTSGRHTQSLLRGDVCCFLVLLSCFSAPLGFPQLCVLWGRFTSASSCLSHVIWYQRELAPTFCCCYFCRLDLLLLLFSEMFPPLNMFVPPALIFSSELPSFSTLEDI